MKLFKSFCIVFFSVVALALLLSGSLVLKFLVEKAISAKSIEHALVVPDLWIDPETQCQYFLVPGGITPRLGTDNFPLCANQIPVGAE